MDSKLKKLTMIAALSVMLLVGLVVFLLNGGPGGVGNSIESNASTTDSTSVADNTDTTSTSTVTKYVTGQIGDDLSAFLRDNTFFDEESNTYLERMLEESNRLSLVVTSVEKDLRIQVIDSMGQLVENESFFVNVEGLGEYKDLDKDGIIYIGDLDSGDYEVTLQPMEGYRVPSGATTVRVKDKVEYVYIDDISLLIKTEDEINAAEEDTAQAIDDADKSEIKGMQTLTGNATWGIDVSKWQGEIDWDKVKNAGVDYAIIRCGYRGSKTGSLVEDPYYVQNIKGATAAGVKVGIYFFTQAIDSVEAVEEASMVISLVRDYQLTYPVFIDTEGAGGNGRADALDVTTRTEICEAFCATLENAGYEAGVYASRNWYNNNLNVVSLERYTIWLAEYRKAPLYQGYYQMWQYSSKGSVDGIDGNVDMNISYLGY